MKKGTRRPDPIACVCSNSMSLLLILIPQQIIITLLTLISLECAGLKSHMEIVQAFLFYVQVLRATWGAIIIPRSWKTKKKKKIITTQVTKEVGKEIIIEDIT